MSDRGPTQEEHIEVLRTMLMLAHAERDQLRQSLDAAQARIARLERVAEAAKQIKATADELMMRNPTLLPGAIRRVMGNLVVELAALDAPAQEDKQG